MNFNIQKVYSVVLNIQHIPPLPSLPAFCMFYYKTFMNLLETEGMAKTLPSQGTRMAKSLPSQRFWDNGNIED